MFDLEDGSLMGESIQKTNSSPASSLARQSIVLALVLAVPFPLIAWVQFRSHGQDGVAAAVAGAFVCFIAGILALAVTGLAQELGEGLNGLLASILIRTGIPLAAGVFFHSRGGTLADAGVFGVIMVYYLLMLAVETLLAVQSIRHSHPGNAGAEGKVDGKALASGKMSDGIPSTTATGIDR